jgi:nitrite reductase/ring-hydroxylating ferredoxin subunit
MSAAPGSELCRIADLERTGAKCVHLPDADRRFPRAVVVVRVGDHVRAFRNRCPHRGTPLETFPDEILDRQTGALVCSTHGARFRASDGVCVSGPCPGARLEPVAIAIDGDRVVLAGRPPP